MPLSLAFIVRIVPLPLNEATALTFAVVIVACESSDTSEFLPAFSILSVVIVPDSKFTWQSAPFIVTAGKLPSKYVSELP